VALWEVLAVELSDALREEVAVGELEADEELVTDSVALSEAESDAVRDSDAEIDREAESVGLGV
jgi:hypothetical protein